MNKDKIIELLEKNRGRYISGEEIAAQLDISRTAVWKRITALRDEGYKIEAITHKGYVLLDETDVLSETGIRCYLDPKYANNDIYVYKSIDSTNTMARSLADRGFKDGTLVVAESQTGGRGRMGRSFFSPKGGLYMSLMLRPQSFKPEKVIKITTMAAVAACEAIEDISTQKPLIKWVNDIYMDGKKVCGILTEASMGLEYGVFDYAVLGIGFNLCVPEGGFPPEISSIAGAVTGLNTNDRRNKLSAYFVNHFMRYYLDPALDYISFYRKRNFIIGKKIDVLRGAERQKATALDIDNDCKLKVSFDDGSEALLSSGEVSILV